MCWSQLINSLGTVTSSLGFPAQKLWPAHEGRLSPPDLPKRAQLFFHQLCHNIDDVKVLEDVQSGSGFAANYRLHRLIFICFCPRLLLRENIRDVFQRSVSHEFDLFPSSATDPKFQSWHLKTWRAFVLPLEISHPTALQWWIMIGYYAPLILMMILTVPRCLFQVSL